MTPALNLANPELQSATPEQALKGGTAADYDILWGEIASRTGARKFVLQPDRRDTKQAQLPVPLPGFRKIRRVCESAARSTRQAATFPSSRTPREFPRLLEGE